MFKKTNFLALSLIILSVIFLSILFVLFNNYFIKKFNTAEHKEEINKPSLDNKVQQFEKVKIQTEDGVEIVGILFPNESSKFAGILLHMMPETKESYIELGKYLQKLGYTVLAIDFRGHGESINSVKGKLDYTKFTDEEHQNYIYDLKAASDYLSKKGFVIENQFLIGASIGANIALQFLSMNPNIKAVVLLSPGENYRGIKIKDYLNKKLEDKIMVIIGKNDIQSFNSLDEFKNITPSSTILVINTNAHGTDILKLFPDIILNIVNFLREKLI